MPSKYFPQGLGLIMSGGPVIQAGAETPAPTAQAGPPPGSQEVTPGMWMTEDGELYDNNGRNSGYIFFRHPTAVNGFGQVSFLQPTQYARQETAESIRQWIQSIVQPATFDPIRTSIEDVSAFTTLQSRTEELSVMVMNDAKGTQVLFNAGLVAVTRTRNIMNDPNNAEANSQAGLLAECKNAGVV